MSNKTQASEIASGIRRNHKAIRAAERRFAKSRLILEGFPFDAWLLSLSPLYRRSRERYLEMGGSFRAGVISSPRTLSSTSLLETVIEYSPLSGELYWAATDPVERKNLTDSHARILELREYCASVFHEQSHRLLWRFLPPPPRSEGGISRYLNFCEALVIATDMALGDSLGPTLSRLFYLTGATYDPGTRTLQEIKKGRAAARRYRNYLHQVVLASFLYLELHEPDEILNRIGAQADPLMTRAVERALRLDQAFVRITNVGWQQKNWKLLRRFKGAGSKAALDPGDSWLIYLWAEKWFEEMGL